MSGGLLALWWTVVFHWLGEELLASEECDWVCYDVTMNVTWDLPATRRHFDILVSEMAKRSANIYLWAQFTRSHHMCVWVQPLSHPFLQLLILRNSKFRNAWKFWFVLAVKQLTCLYCVLKWNKMKYSFRLTKLIHLTFLPLAKITINNGQSIPLKWQLHSLFNIPSNTTCRVCYIQRNEYYVACSRL